VNPEPTLIKGKNSRVVQSEEGCLGQVIASNRAEREGEESVNAANRKGKSE